jgi:hypothetical protein
MAQFWRTSKKHPQCSPEFWAKKHAKYHAAPHPVLIVSREQPNSLAI